MLSLLPLLPKTIATIFRSRQALMLENLALGQLIQDMQQANRYWGEPRSHGELLKLGIEVSQATISNYMIRFC